jgi:hypothetical protein
VGKLFSDVAGTNLFFQVKSEEEENLLQDSDQHPVGLLTEAEIQRMLMDEYGEDTKPKSVDTK